MDDLITFLTGHQVSEMQSSALKSVTKGYPFISTSERAQSLPRHTAQSTQGMEGSPVALKGHLFGNKKGKVYMEWIIV